MASCKDCIHFDRCKGLYKFGRLQKTVSKGCPYFKDRSRFVELPQSVHLCDAVHFVLKGLDEIDLRVGGVVCCCVRCSLYVISNARLFLCPWYSNDLLRHERMGLWNFSGNLWR